MLPIREVRDRSVPRRPAVVITTLVIVNVLVFLLEQAMIEGGDTRFPFDWGLVPRVLTGSDPAHGALTVLTSMFLHGSWMHLLGNLWFLWLFGPAVEDALGHARFVALYLLGGVAAAAAQVIVDPSSTVPMLGASGAIGAVLAAYVSLYPLRRILTFFVVILWPLPSFLFVGEWFLLNLFQGVGAIGIHPDASGGVAWWAHVGGFLSGLLLVRLLFPHRDDDRMDPTSDARHRSIDGGDVIVRGEDGRRMLTSRGERPDDDDDRRVRFETMWNR
jgi:membrane associated rhomboid family serine protease